MTDSEGYGNSTFRGVSTIKSWFKTSRPPLIHLSFWPSENWNFLESRCKDDWRTRYLRFVDPVISQWRLCGFWDVGNVGMSSNVPTFYCSWATSRSFDCFLTRSARFEWNGDTTLFYSNTGHHCYLTFPNGAFINVIRDQPLQLLKSHHFEGD